MLRLMDLGSLDHFSVFSFFIFSELLIEIFEKEKQAGEEKKRILALLLDKAKKPPAGHLCQLPREPQYALLSPPPFCLKQGKEPVYLISLLRTAHNTGGEGETRQET